MNVNSRNHTLSKNLRQLIAAPLAAFFIFASVPTKAGATVSIVDTLGVATPATQFNAIGGNGFALTFNQFPGPKFGSRKACCNGVQRSDVLQNAIEMKREAIAVLV